MMVSRTFSSRPSVAFVDACSTASYDLTDLTSGGLGGTEATVLRVARAIATSFDVTIYQNGRENPKMSPAGQLRPWRGNLDDQPSMIVVINRWKVAVKLRKAYPDTPIHIWLHVYPGKHNRKMGAALKAAGISVICVSKAHAKAVAEFLPDADCPPVTAIYNPIADDLQPDDTTREPSRLLFASSPHKGLREVFGQFRLLRESIPDLTLAVADPGYLAWDTGPVPDGVVCLGSLSHGALLHQMRRSLCLFYPQTTFAETFGLVMAEANAVGTPVLVHRDLGANAEVVADHRQLIDGTDSEALLNKILSWQRSPPVVASNPAFRIEKVAEAWRDFISQTLAGQMIPTQNAANLVA